MGEGRNRRGQEQRVIAAIDQLRELLAIAEGVEGAFVAGVQVEDLRLALLELDAANARADSAEAKAILRLARAETAEAALPETQELLEKERKTSNRLRVALRRIKARRPNGALSDAHDLCDIAAAALTGDAQEESSHGA